MRILLTDKEIAPYLPAKELLCGALIAKAQLKRVVELLKACDGELVSRNEGPFMATFEMLATDYQALLEEAGLNKEDKE